MRRIVIVGPSGAGKSTLAREIARRDGVPHIEMDALHWKANWTATETDELRLLVEAATTPVAWVLDGNYSKVRAVIWNRADTIIWLDYAFPLVFGRSLKRTLGRVVSGEELWNGNRESWKTLFSRDSILLWVITSYQPIKRATAEALKRPEFAHLQVVHWRSPRQARQWLKRRGQEGNMSLKDELKEYYTVEELASLLRVTDVAIEKLAQGGEIAHDVAGAVMRIPRREVEKLLGKRRKAKIRRAGFAGVGLLAALIGAFAALKLRNREEDDK